MAKLIVLANRKKGTSMEDFEKHLRQKHLPLVSKLPGITKLTINWCQPGPYGKPPPYDTVGEDYFEDEKAMSAAFNSPAGKALGVDTKEFIDMDSLVALIVKEEEVPLKK